MQQFELIPDENQAYDPRPIWEPNLPPEPPAQPPSRVRSFARGILSGIFAFIAVAAIGLGMLLIGYAVIARRLPPPEALQSAANQLSQSLRIYDSQGGLLNEDFGETEGRRVYVPLEQIPLHLRNATVATEDENFYKHQGVDPVALSRAIYYAVRERGFVSGASTIPQQLVKRIFLSSERSMTRKINEAILAAEVSRRFDKDQILEIYLNEVYYGNLSYGVESAALTYFGKDVSELSLAESALLAGLPQLPAVYDPYTASKNAKKRQGVVLSLMVESGFITTEEADQAWQEELTYVPISYELKSPHFTLYVRQQLETLLPQLTGDDKGSIYQLGLRVDTTLDPQLQAEAERAVRDHLSSLAANNAGNGALIAVDPRTGAIRAMVGSADFNSVEIDGQVNMALAPRQPGSSIKPLVYLGTFEQPDAAIQDRWTPGTLVADISEEFPDGANPPYKPVNYDGKEHGLVTVRNALASSYNIPAVRALQKIGILNFLNLAERLGITTLTRPDYGLSLSLGGGEIPLLEMVGAYGTIANGGRRLPPVAIRKISKNNGEVICEIGTATPCGPSVPPEGIQVISPVDAFLITDILSDNQARTKVFGPNSALHLLAPDGQERPAAVKTGTTNDIRDVLTIGYTPQLVTGVWVGNADRTPMQNLSGSSGAAPIWNRFMSAALVNEPPIGFAVPNGVRDVEICIDTGTEPSEACPTDRRRRYWFANDRLPLSSEHDLYQKVRLDLTTGKLATEFTPPEAIEEKTFIVYPEPYREWAEQHGYPQPPTDQSDVFTFQPEVFIQQPREGETVSGVIAVIGTANIPAFDSFELQYGVSHDPGAFSLPFDGPKRSPLINGVLGQWDLSGLNDGPYTLRLVAHNRLGKAYESRVRVFVAKPTATPEPSPTWTLPPPIETVTGTATPFPTVPLVETPTETPTEIPTEVPTAVPTLTPEPTQPPAETATPVSTPVATEVPTVAPTEIPTEIPTEVPTAAPSETATPTNVPADPEPTPTWTVQAAQETDEASTITETVPITESVPITQTNP